MAMTESTLLRQIGEANKSFLAGTPRFLDPDGQPFVVIACIDPRLTGFLEPALGLPRHRVVMIRTAGNQLSAKVPDALRSLAVALYAKNAREIVIVGHTDCGMSGFSVSEVTDNFRKAGIPRSVFGDEDLRAWFGAFASIRDNLLSSIDYLHKSGLVPREVKIHGLIFDTNKGTFEVVVDGDLVHEITATPVSVAIEEKVVPPGSENEKREAVTDVPAPSIPPVPPHAQAEPLPKKGPIIVGQPASKTDQSAAAPGSVVEAALVLRDFFNRERQNQHMQKTIADLRSIWRQERNPFHVFSELQKVVNAYQARYPNLPGALAYLEDAIRSGSADKFGFGEILKQILD